MFHKMIAVAGPMFVVAVFSLAPVDIVGVDSAGFKKGDTVFVVADGTELKLGDAVREKLAKGTPVKVVEVRGTWIGGDTQIDGKRVQGWIRIEDLSRVSPVRAPAKAVSVAKTAETDEAQKTVDSPAKGGEVTEAKKAKENLADKFKKMMAEKERGAQGGTTITHKGASEKSTKTPVLPAAAKPTGPTDASKQKTGKILDAETTAAKSNTPGALPLKPVKKAAPTAVAQPDKVVSNQAKRQTDEKKPVEPKSPNDSAPLTKGTPEKLASPSTTKVAKEKEKATAGDTRTKAGDDHAGAGNPGEGPEVLAEKFARMLAEQNVRKKEDEASQKPEQQKPAAQPAPKVKPESKPKPVAAMPPVAQDQKFTTSVLVLRLADDIADVKSSERIEQLVITGDEFTNRSLKGLIGLTVSSLSIQAVNVSNIGLQYLKQMHGIRSLRLWSPGFDDDALTLLKDLTGLEFLDIEGTAISGVGFGSLKDMQKLEMLVLGPNVSDATIAGLANLPSLMQLDLRACPRLTLACVESIAKLKHLKVVWLPRNLRTKAKRALRVTLPGCQVRS